MVAAAKGYHLIIVMPETMSIERRKLMQGYGAELILTPGAEGMKGSIAKATQLAEDNGYFMPMQFENPANPDVHEQETGQEIIEAFGKDDLPDAFVAGVGTGGTLTGIGHALKELDQEIKVYALEPSESPVLKNGVAGKHKIQGISAGFVPEVLTGRFMTESSKFQAMKPSKRHAKLHTRKDSFREFPLEPIFTVQSKLPKTWQGQEGRHCFA